MRPRRNHSIWLGPLVTFAAAVSYFQVFSRYPVLRDFPWLNLPLTLVGLAISIRGLVRAFGAGRRWPGKLLGSLGLAFSLAVAGLFAFYIFDLSYGLPAPSEVATSLVQAPDFEIEDQHGRPIRIDALRGRKILLTFYRGHW